MHVHSLMPRMCMCMYACACACECACLHAHCNTYTWTWMCAHARISILCTCTYQCTHGCNSTHAQEQREWQHARQSAALTQQNAATNSKSSKLLGVGATAEEAGALRLEVCSKLGSGGVELTLTPTLTLSPTLTLQSYRLPQQYTRTLEYPTALLYWPLGEAARAGDRSALSGNCASERRAAAARGRGALAIYPIV